MALKLQFDEASAREAELKRDKRSLKLELKELELAHEDVIRELKQVRARAAGPAAGPARLRSAGSCCGSRGRCGCARRGLGGLLVGGLASAVSQERPGGGELGRLRAEARRGVCWAAGRVLWPAAAVVANLAARPWDGASPLEQPFGALRLHALRPHVLLLPLSRPQEHDKNISKLRQEYERNVKELFLKADKKVKLLRDELELRRKVEILEIQERKNAHINELMRKHEKVRAAPAARLRSRAHLVGGAAASAVSGLTRTPHSRPRARLSCRSSPLRPRLPRPPLRAGVRRDQELLQRHHAQQPRPHPQPQGGGCRHEQEGERSAGGQRGERGQRARRVPARPLEHPPRTPPSLPHGARADAGHSRARLARLPRAAAPPASSRRTRS